MCAYLHLLLGQFKIEGIKVALDVGHAGCFRNDTGAVLNGPSDQDLHTPQKLTQRSEFLHLMGLC